MNEIPLGVRHSIESGNSILFIGSGIGKHMHDKVGNPAPTGTELAEEIASHYSIETGGINDLAKIAQIVENKKGRKELLSFLHKRLYDLQPDEYYKWIFKFRWKAIYTTNYDNSIINAYNSLPNPQQTPVPISITPEIVPCDSFFNVPVYFIHGRLYDTTNTVIIITENDYSRYKMHRKMLFEKMKYDFATSTVIYVGYSNNDQNWKTIITELSDEFYPTPLPQSYRIAPTTDLLDISILKDNKNIETINLTYEEFVNVAIKELKYDEIDYKKIQQLKTTIPTELAFGYDNNPAAMLRLLSSWTYVNQAPFNEKPNITHFIKGDRPNWALLGNKLYFIRDIEEQVYEDLLDYATSDASIPSTIIIIGSAGYGTTTLIMALAARLVEERAGIILMHRPGTPFIEGDIEYALSTFDKRVFFIIDNAADYSVTLNSVIHKMKENNKTSMFILGERKNEWRQARIRPRGKEYEIEPLSDNEICRLIDFLAANSALNKLEFLTRELQIKAIKNNYNKELLIAMKEATEDTQFDAIIMDEFRGIDNINAQKMYLAACCFYQHGAYLRDTLLANIIGIPQTELYTEINKSLDGVVVFECIDEREQKYIARARHRTIAQIVWERCGSQSEQEHLIQLSLDLINLNYNTDIVAFEAFVKSDRIVKQIHSLDGKIRFFETCCRKDPESPYVRQHYARMLAKENKYEIALSQIDEALKLDPQIRILYHTKGYILSLLAESITSIDIARRRLVQAEENFRQSLKMYNKDEYSYQGLAHLYLCWAKRAQTQEEATLYIEKSEQVISEGLNKVAERDSLWIESSNIQEYLGDNPQYVLKLEKAVDENPGSIIARYLLGRAYFNNERIDDTIKMLEPNINNHTEEFRSFIIYALALTKKINSYNESIAILRLSSLYGLSDSRYISTLGGMLFLNNQFIEAQNVFNESNRRNISITEKNMIYYAPFDFQNPDVNIVLQGTVIKVKAGYSFIETAGFPQIICPGSKYRGLVMREGMKVLYEIAFNAKGPIAVNPEQI